MPRKLQFDVIHVSGHDDDHSGRELEVHSPLTKGWQSTRFCVYPQEIVLMLKEPSRIRKLQLLSHQYLVASKVELFVGGSVTGFASDVLNTKFQRLGYVPLSDNVKSSFKARELKSIHVDAEGQFIKLLVHKNHINKHNIYNQVNIIAINVIGDPVSRITEENSRQILGHDVVDEVIQQYLQTETHSQPISDPVLYGKINRPDYISPLDDLAFDMYQDPETAQLIRRLEEKKRDAVLEERYDYAKKLKQAMADLQKVGEKLGRFEVEKRRAIELEDYDLAKKKKLQSDEYRLYVYKQLDLFDLLELHKETKTSPTQPRTSLPPLALNHGDRVSSRALTSPLLPKLQFKSNSPGPRHVPASDSPGPSAATVVQQETELKEVNIAMRNEFLPDPDDRPLPALKGKNQPEEFELEISQKSEDQPEEDEELSETDEREAGPIIDAFGMPLARKVYSKSWKARQDGVNTVNEELALSSPVLTAEKDPKAVLRASVLVLKKTFKDQVVSVFQESLNLFKFLLLKYIPQRQLGKPETSFVIDKALPELLKRVGDSATRTRDLATSSVIEIATLKDVKAIGNVPDILMQPIKSKGQIPFRLLKSRTEIIDKLMMPLDVDKQGGFTTEGIMKILFCHANRFASMALSHDEDFLLQMVTAGLQHNNNDAREAAILCLFSLYKKVGQPVKKHLPPDEPSTRKNPLYSRIFDGFDSIDGKPTAAERKAMAKKEEDAKKDEIAALQAQLQALRAAAAKIGNEPDAQSQAPTEMTVRDEVINIEKMCIFCGEHSEEFNEETLDTHYWKSCPMLKRCEYCNQVAEISTLHEHFLTECDRKDAFSKCGRCKEAILTTDYDEHIRSKACPITRGDKASNRCFFCKTTITKGEEGWKKHLMVDCKANAKRLQMQQQGKPLTKAPTTKSQRGGAVPRRGKSSGIPTRTSNVK